MLAHNSGVKSHSKLQYCQKFLAALHLLVTAFNGRPAVVFNRRREMSKVKLRVFENPTSKGTMVRLGSLVLNIRLGSMNLNIKAPTKPTMQHHLVMLHNKTALQS